MLSNKFIYGGGDRTEEVFNSVIELTLYLLLVFGRSAFSSGSWLLCGHGCCRIGSEVNLITSVGFGYYHDFYSNRFYNYDFGIL